jgi:FKBP-type peptidyl-prolyl cis-trans isomerase FkpA
LSDLIGPDFFYCCIYQSGGSLPQTEELKSFYALGVNVARQVGGELKGLMSSEELDAMLQGFEASMHGRITDEKELLMKYGSQLNDILASRANKAVSEEMQRGKDFVEKYLLSSPRAIKMPSGLVFDETLLGIGKQATIDSTVLVHYHGMLIDGTVFDSSVDVSSVIHSFSLSLTLSLFLSFTCT